jgi:hypothetical protein
MYRIVTIFILVLVFTPYILVPCQSKTTLVNPNRVAVSSRKPIRVNQQNLVDTTQVASPPDSVKFKMGVLPSAFYTPETCIGVGTLIYTNFKSGNFDTLQKKSNTQSYLSYTQKKQFSFENDYQIWLRKNTIYLSGSADYSRFPELFYGIGNMTQLEGVKRVSFDVVKIKAKNLLLISSDLYGGIAINYQRLYNIDINLMDNTNCMEVNGGMGYEAKGIGPVLILDKRDNPLNPAKGSYVEASFMDFKSVIKNENSFNTTTLDARKYTTIFKKLVWNGNIYLSLNKGQVPFRMMPSIGGARFLRGYYNGRFRDNNMLIIQQEFRVRIYKAIGLAIFNGIGKVAKTTSELTTNQMHYNYGIGLRLRLNKKENTNLRIDYGRTKDSQGIYVVYAEAF